MATNSASHESLWATPQKMNLRYGLVVLCVLSQFMTVAMSWPLWQVRPPLACESMLKNAAIGGATEYVDVVMPAPMMPVIELPQIPFGWLMLATLGLVLLCPRWGVPLHTAVLLVSFVFDQYRTQPQFMANVALMWGCANLRAMGVVRWVLISLWLWAGLHKLLSPDWMGPGSWYSLNEINFFADELYYAFAIFVAGSEILLGVLAIVKPRWAAYYCVALHVGICLYLSPWLRNWNESVVPWNLCTAAVGCWIMLHSKPGWPENRGLQWAAAALLIYPAGFYTGWIDHGISHVLYSDNHAIAMVTQREYRDTSNDPPESEQLVPIPGWVDRGLQISGFGALRVPFPNERRLHLIYFAKVARPGEKMHIHDPRPWAGDEYFLKQTDGGVLQIDAPRFFTATETEVGGVAMEPWRYYFSLGLADVTMTRRDLRSPIFAAKFTPQNYRPAAIENLGKLANLEQLEFKDCPVTDADLQRLPMLYKLRGIGLNGTRVTLAGLRHLLKYPNLDVVQFGNGNWSRADLQELTKHSE
jgi:uncharacterized membrane protein YphA (DoxX/SURF4 family)